MSRTHYRSRLLECLLAAFAMESARASEIHFPAEGFRMTASTFVSLAAFDVNVDGRNDAILVDAVSNSLRIAFEFST